MHVIGIDLSQLCLEAKQMCDDSQIDSFKID